MSDPNPYPKADFGRNANNADVLIIGAGIAGTSQSFCHGEIKLVTENAWNRHVYRN